MNATMSTNETTGNATSHTDKDQVFRATKIVFYFLILSASTFGNATVAFIICNFKKMRTASNFLILNLALCDMLTPLVSITFDFALEENGYEWMYGGFGCKVLWPCQTFFSTVSSLTLAAIALDRYCIIMHPFTTRLSAKQITLILVTIYVFCAIAMSPYVHFLELEGNQCVEKWPPSKIYRQSFTVFLFLIQYALPLVFMVVVYSLALRNLCGTRGKMRSHSICSNDRDKYERRDNKARHKLCPDRLAALYRRVKGNSWKGHNAKATQMFMIVVAVFAIFMLPSQVVWLWGDFGGGQENPSFNKLSIICWLFTYTNSVVNPIIFRTLNKDFRSGFQIVFGKICRVCTRSGKVENARRYLRKRRSGLSAIATAETTSALSETNSDEPTGKTAFKNMIKNYERERKQSTKWVSEDISQVEMHISLNDVSHNCGEGSSTVFSPPSGKNKTRSEPQLLESLNEYTTDAFEETKKTHEQDLLLLGQDLRALIENSPETNC